MRLSFSSIQLFKKCHRLFYLEKIAKLRFTQEMKWMNRGSCVHTCLEQYYRGQKDVVVLREEFDKSWLSYGLNQSLPNLKSETWKMVEYGIALNLQPTQCEYKLEDVQLEFMAYLDGVNLQTHEIWDYKTSKEYSDEYKLQMSYYAWLYHRKFGVIPHTVVYMLKLGKAVPADYMLDDFREPQREYEETKKFVETHMDEEDYPACDNIYCPCHGVNTQGNQGVQKFRIKIQGNKCVFEGKLPELLLEGIDKELKYPLKNKYRIQQAVIKKMGGKSPPNIDDIGTVHLFNKKYQTFFLGSLEKVKTLVQDYCAYKNIIPCDLYVEDMRDTDVLTTNLNTSWGPQVTPLRDYQQDVVKTFLEKQMGFLEMATGSGKTLVATEIIRRLDTTTLFLIDRKEILWQTKKVFEKELGVPIGVIAEGKFSPQNITVATVQTMMAHVHEKFIQQYLAKINLVIVDEGHHAKCMSYQEVMKYLVNTKYRLALTGTAFRDDGNSPVLFALMGPILFHISADDLIKRGYLVQPSIKFIDVLKVGMEAVDYHEVYRECVVKSTARNRLIYDLVNIHREAFDHKILILTNRIEHGKILSDFISEKLCIPCVYITGDTDNTDRISWFDKFRDGDVKVMVGTLSIFSEGIDIPDLNVIINAAANKGDVKSIQILGRVLRLFVGKGDAIYYDFNDGDIYLQDASLARKRVFKKQGHVVELLSASDIGIVDASEQL